MITIHSVLLWYLFVGNLILPERDPMDLCYSVVSVQVHITINHPK
jgi:hypothetical protein